jgi:hypothetical protein
MTRRRKSRKSDFGSSKPGYFEKLKMGTSHPTYDVEKEGLGSQREWEAAFNVRMGFAEAQRHKGKKWGSDWKKLGDLAGIHLDEKSMWSDVKKAFRKVAMANNFNFDRSNKTEAEIKAAEEGFMDAQASYAMLEDIYRTEGRLQ